MPQTGANTEKGKGFDELSELMIPGTPKEVCDSYRTLSERALTAVFGIDEPEVVVFDTETTGLRAGQDELMEIAAAIMRGPEIVARFSTFVNPQRPIPPEITDLTGIDASMVRDAPSPDAAVREFFDFVGNRDLIAHNISFDKAFVEYHASKRFTGAWIDSLELARIALPRLRNHKLESLSGAFHTASSSHRAIDDVEALCGVWRVLLVALSDFPEGLLGFIADLRPDTPWPLRPILKRVAAEKPPARFSLSVCRGMRVSSTSAPAKIDADDAAIFPPPPSEIEECFSEGSIVGRMYPGYEHREEQVAMAQEVVAAFSTSTHRAIEAGTGVGKSIAYLLPAALTAQRCNIGIGVATKTNVLMDQLVFHELPKLSQQLDQPLRYVALKGYEHYPCLRKLERFAAEEPPLPGDHARPSASAELSMLAILYAFVGQTGWGDLDSVNLRWKDVPLDQVCARPDDCLHQHCRYYPTHCLLHGLRQQAKSADIVVTNHALLFRDVLSGGSILPPVRHWIIDEAHAVEEEARKQLSPSVDMHVVLAMLDELSGQPSSVLRTMRHGITKLKVVPSELLAAVDAAEEEAAQAYAIAESFFSFVHDLEDLAEHSEYDSVELWVNQGVRESGKWSVVRSTGTALARRLEELVARLRSMITMSEDTALDKALIADLVSITGHIHETWLALGLCIDGEDDGYVYSAQIDRSGRHRSEALVASLFDVGATLAEGFYPRMHSVIYTSATISVGSSDDDGGFKHFAHATGLDRLEPGTWKCLRLTTSYDYENHMTVLVPKDMPDPNQASYLESLSSLLLDVHRAMGGSVLTLFTNRRDMESLYARVAPQLEEEGMSLLCQFRGTSSKRLRDEFLDDEKASLFALRSFWEGFDAPGETLRCVVIPRLPFGRPTDPLQQERKQREENAWSRYALPEAVLDLKQAAGRLIRSSEDTGYLVLADSRLVTKRYGRAFLQALPTTKYMMLPASVLADEISRHENGS